MAHILRPTVPGLVALMAAAACSSGETPPGVPSAVPHVPLSLPPAPPGLCDGGGAKKDGSSSSGSSSSSGGTTTGSGTATTTGSGSSSGGWPGYGGAGSGGGAWGTGGGWRWGEGGTSRASTGGGGGGGGGTSVGVGGEASGGAAGSGGGATAAGGTCEAAAGAGGASAECGTAGSGGTVFFMSDPSACAGVDLSTPMTLYVSSDDSNSMASPAIVRSLIRGGYSSVDPLVVRTYEFLNYYRFAFAPPPPGELAVVSQLGSCNLDTDIALQIAVTSPLSPVARRPMNVTLVLDTSGSMGGEPVALERAAVKALASALQAGDVVSAVTWSDDQVPVLDGHIVTGPDDPTLVALADSLDANGSTNLHAGLAVGYALATKYKTADRINRVVLISDGQANVGITDEAIIGSGAEDQDSEGIYLVGIGVGAGIDDTLMDVVTDAGRGAYVFLDSESEAERMLVDRFAETILVAARGVRIEVTLPPYFKIKKFYGEEYSPDPTKVRPQHLAPNDSMMLFQILHPCDPTLPSTNDPYRVRVTWTDPATGAQREALEDTTLGQLGVDDGNLTKAAAVVAYAESLKKLSVLEPADRIGLLEEVRDTVTAANPSGTDPDLAEIAGLLDELAANQPP